MVEAEPSGAVAPTTGGVKDAGGGMMKMGGMKMGAGVKKGKSAAAPSFAVDDGPKMGPLVPIEYSEEERKAVADLVPAAPPAAAAPAPAAAISAEALKALIATIPTQREALYAEGVDWETVEAAGVVEAKLRPFVAKKMHEYLGEDEPSLVEHVVGKLRARTAASVLEDELAKVLDDEAQVFVVKLWRMLLFEMRAKQAGQST